MKSSGVEESIKQGLRRLYARRRALLDDATRLKHEERAISALDALVCSPPLPKTVATYWAVGDEFPTSRIISLCMSRRLSVALPRWNAVRRAYAWALYRASDEMRLGPMGIPEPPDSAPEIPALSVDLFLAPGLAFDETGGRIGYGGGWFDRLMSGARHDARIRGLCFPCQISMSPLPREVHDIPAPPLLNISEKQ